MEKRKGMGSETCAPKNVTALKMVPYLSCERGGSISPGSWRKAAGSETWAPVHVMLKDLPRWLVWLEECGKREA
jgi:hypothetical protein